MEPVNFLQSTALKINQEYVSCATDAVMDVQDAQDMQDSMEFDFDSKDWGKRRSGDVELGNHMKFNTETIVFKKDDLELERTEEVDAVDDVAAVEKEIIIETDVCNDFSLQGVESYEVTKKARCQDEDHIDTPNLSSETIEMAEETTDEMNVDLNEVHSWSETINIHQEVKDKPSEATQVVSGKNEEVEGPCELLPSKDNEILPPEEAEETSQPEIDTEDQGILFLQCQSAENAEEHLLCDAYSDVSMDQENINMLLKDSEDEEYESCKVKHEEKLPVVIEKIKPEPSSEEAQVQTEAVTGYVPEPVLISTVIDGEVQFDLAPEIEHIPEVLDRVDVVEVIEGDDQSFFVFAGEYASKSALKSNVIEDISDQVKEDDIVVEIKASEEAQVAKINVKEEIKTETEEQLLSGIVEESTTGLASEAMKIEESDQVNEEDSVVEMKEEQETEDIPEIHQDEIMKGEQEDKIDVKEEIATEEQLLFGIAEESTTGLARETTKIQESDQVKEEDSDVEMKEEQETEDVAKVHQDEIMKEEQDDKIDVKEEIETETEEPVTGFTPETMKIEDTDQLKQEDPAVEIKAEEQETNDIPKVHQDEIIAEAQDDKADMKDDIKTKTEEQSLSVIAEESATGLAGVPETMKIEDIYHVQEEDSLVEIKTEKQESDDISEAPTYKMDVIEEIDSETEDKCVSLIADDATESPETIAMKDIDQVKEEKADTGVKQETENIPGLLRSEIVEEVQEMIADVIREIVVEEEESKEGAETTDVATESAPDSPASEDSVVQDTDETTQQLQSEVIDLIEEEEENADDQDMAESTDLVIDEEIDEPPELQEDSTLEEVEELPKLIPIQAMKQTTGKGNNDNDLPPELIPITKPNNRLLMAQLIERKLQGEMEDYDYQSEGEESNTSDHSTELHIVLPEDDSPSKQVHDIDEKSIEDLIKKPIIGCVRKSVRKTERMTKPPWLIENEEGSDEEALMEQEEDVITTPEEEKLVTNGIDMREKLASQLQMLKVKKKTASLFDAKMPNFSSVTHYQKRVVKSGSNLKEVATSSPSPLGLKIVAVAGGIDLESCKKAIAQPLEDCLDEQLEESDKSTDSLAKEVIINDHLDLPTIKLTKTKDYKKIKGWSKKKLLTLDAENVEADDVVDLDVDGEANDDPTPSCSYAALVDSAKSDVDVDGDTKQSKEGNVFASNSLDGFLQEKDLNISYNVPNLKSTNHNINLLDACMLVDVEEDKARKLQAENEDSSSQSSFKERLEEGKGSTYKPRTLAEKRKMLIDEQDGIEPKKMRSMRMKHKKFSRRPISSRFESPTSSKEPLNELTREDVEENLLVPLDESTKTICESPAKNPRVVFLSEEESKPKDCVTSHLKIRSSIQKTQSYAVVTRKPVKRFLYDKCSDIKRKGSFDLIPKKLLEAQRNKLSIIQNPVEVTYRPGPLCKKKELQVNGCKEWQTVVVDLPKVKVEVLPQVGKKMNPVVRPFVKFDTFDISKNRAEYAVSVLQSGNKKKTEKDNVIIKFSFSAKYAHKQEKVVMRKLIPKINKKKSKEAAEKPKPETAADVLSACENVISGMLNYVETKELGDALLKYDSDAETKVEQKLEPLPPAPPVPPVAAQNVPPAKKSRDYDRVYHELRRLNVRTVELPTEERSEKPPPCTRDKYCTLGCVCRSIASRYPPWNHCGEAKCMFACVCGYETKDSKNTLTDRTLNRYSKDAKKNITAREERDFTQTAIRSKNKTIILGNNRVSKRVPKYNFKRYEGFQFSFSDMVAEQNRADKVVIPETVSQKLIRTDKKLHQCQVNLVRCNFDDVVPFCLVHNLYDCHCKGTAVYCPIDKLMMNNHLKIAQSEEDATVSLAKKSSQSNVQPAEAPPAGGKTDLVTNPDGLSARMRGTGLFFRERNKTNRYKNILARKLKYDTTVDAEIVNRWVILPLEVPGLNKINTKAKDKARPITAPALRQSLSSESENSIINIDDDVNTNNNSMQQRRKRKHKPIPDPDVAVKPRGKLLKSICTDLTITGALYSPTSSISKQFSQMINQKAPAQAEFRLLLWASMMKLHEEEAIHIWISTCTNKLRFIITDSLSNPKTGYVNIRTYQDTAHSEIKVDLIRWIITKTVPENKSSDNMLMILKIHHLFWEICGICAKNNNNNSRIAADQTGTATEEVIQTVSEKYYKTVQHVMFANGTFAPKQLMLLSNKDVLCAEYEMNAALPHIISNCRWRMLRVNSTFAILAFTRNEFRIKCSDILTVMKVAAKYDKTIIINTAEVSENYEHKLFGIYIPPTFSDRIFIGPYLPNEEHGLETLRYVNNDLVNTEQFNKMRGIKNTASTGLWYYQLGRAEPAGAGKRTEPSGAVIDLTDLDEVRSLMKSTDITVTATTIPTPAAQATPTPGKPVFRKKQKRKILATTTPLEKFGPTADISQHEPEIPLPKLPNNSYRPILPNLSKEIVTLDPVSPPSPTLHNGIEHVDVDHVEATASSRDKMPKLIKLPLKPNTTNRNITQVDVDGSMLSIEERMSMDTLDDIMRNGKDVDVDAMNLERCFTMRLKIIMKQMGLEMPARAKPICFRLNFGNGIILAYILLKQVHVFWPGDCKKMFQFSHLEKAVVWLSQELHEVFICVPSTFRIMVTPVGPAHYMEYINRGIISQKYFKEICIIGDFGIMRLSEAQRYLMYTDKRHALNALRRSDGKSNKFKKAIAQIIESNDMTKVQFQKRLRNLIMKAKAAADTLLPAESTESNQTSAIEASVAQSTTPQPTAEKEDEVICVDSDDEDPNAQETEAQATQEDACARLVVISSKAYKQARERRVQKRVSLLKPRTPEVPVKKRAYDEVDLRQEESNVMQIDLTHMTTEKVKALLKGQGLGNNAALTVAQVNRLKALSRSPNTPNRSNQNGFS